MYRIIGYRPSLSPAARGMLNRQFGEYSDAAWGYMLRLLPDGTMVEHEGRQYETARGRLILDAGGQYIDTPPEPYHFSADDYLANLYECAELYAQIYWRKHGNTNPGGSPRPVYQANARGSEMDHQAPGVFRRRLPVNHLGN